MKKGPGFALGPFLLPAISSGLCLVVSADEHPNFGKRPKQTQTSAR